ncbi:MAG TPA: DUF5020 family protein [Puia sp.]|nr:DUF5020 family protein [Puia sp.]
MAIARLQNIEFREISAAITALLFPSTDIYYMKYLLFASLLFSCPLLAQNLQLHYDLRHSTDPAHNPHNLPTVYFEYFKAQDTGSSRKLTGPDSTRGQKSSRKPTSLFIQPGSFLFKTQADLSGAQNNIGKFYMQVTQSFRCWKPKIYLSLQYSGGLGVTEPKQYSYYINNTFSAGVDLPFHWKETWFSSVLDYKYVPYTRPSHDFLYTLYWWKGLLHYKLELSGDFSIWTENKDHGDAYTANLRGKRFFFFAEPQVWYNIGKKLSLGSKINMYYHVNTTDNLFQVYPTIAVKCKF